MKKHLNIFVIVLFSVLTISFTSCSKDEEEPIGSNIVGTWLNVESISNAMGIKQYIQFAENGQYYEVNIYPASVGGEVDVLKGQWNKDGNSIKITGNDLINVTATIKTLTGDNLVIELFGISQKYKRVSDSAIDQYL